MTPRYWLLRRRLALGCCLDCTCIMERGCIIERGTHDELMAKRGRYWQLYTGGKVGE